MSTNDPGRPVPHHGSGPADNHARKTVNWQGRDTSAAATRLMHADQAQIELFARHDPDMIRDVAAALIYERALRTCADRDAAILRGLNALRDRYPRDRYLSKRFFCCDNLGHGGGYPTHWIPLPKPPELA